MNVIIYTQTARVERLNRETADDDLTKYETLKEDLKINIQPAGPEFIVTEPNGAMGRLFRGFTTYSGVQIGMMVVASGTATVSGMRYEVTGREEYVGPLGKHYELLLRVATD
jgi:hypothetical protein